MTCTRTAKAKSVSALFRAAVLVSAHARRLLLLLALLALATPAFAQKPSLTDFLPAETWLYVHWHGTSSLAGVRGTNSVLRFLNDPSVQAMRQNLIDEIVRQQEKGAKPNPQLRPDIGMVDSLLENQLIFGLVSGTKGAGQSASMGTFLIYDANGKQDQVEKLREDLTKNAAPPPVRTPITIGGHPAFQIVEGKNTSYQAQAGNYFVRADSIALMEELLSRLTALVPPPSQFEAAQQVPVACREFPRGALLDYLALPAKLTVADSFSSPNFNFSAFSKSLHLDQIRAACGSVKFESSATRMKAVILGDTSAGSILNFWADGRDSFATLALAPAGASFGGSILDFAALYSSVRAAVMAALPPDRSGLILGMESMMSAQWGMSPADALGLFTGEMASIRMNPSVDPSQQIYAVAIQQPDKVLGLLRKIFRNSHPAEIQEGDTTYLTLAFPSAPKDSPATPSVQVVGVTPTMLIIAKSQDLVREGMARLHASQNSGAPSGLAVDAEFQKLRATYPRQLDGFGYMDLAHFNWQKVADDAQKALNEQAQAAARSGRKPAPPNFDFFQGFDPQSVARYLHFAVSASWKVSNGIYFDSTVQ